MTPDQAHNRLLADEAIFFGNCDPLVRPIVHAIVDGSDLPDEFLILDTYADVGDPPSEWRCDLIRAEVHNSIDVLGIKMPVTHTCLD
jgi:hypothetical protein